MTASQWMLLPAAAVGAWVLTPWVRRYAAARGIADSPGPRRSHDRVVPRGGGIAIAIAALGCAAAGAASTSTTAVFIAGALTVVLLGWLDDRKPLPAGRRLVVQTAVSAGAVALIGPVTTISAGGIEIGGVWIWSALAIPALIWLMNLFNFMDGADGLAASQCVISCSIYAALFLWAGEFELAWIAAAVAASTTGFLAWNWPPASVFLGDAGSLLLGWAAGVLALAGVVGNAISVWLAFIVVSPFVVDATATLVWRLIRGERWYTPHRDHAYQYLLRSGWSHRGVLVSWIGLNAAIVVPAAAAAIWKPTLDLVIAAAVGTILAGLWCLVHFVHPKENPRT